MYRTQNLMMAIMGIACLATSATAAETGTPVDGQLAFNNNCRTCHSLNEGDNRLGPNLHQIVGRKAAADPEYGYSSALKSSDFAWTPETLDTFIADPNAVVPGNNMKPFSGIAEDEVRAAIIAHLKNQ